MVDTWQVELREDQRHTFREQGFLSFDRMTTDTELAWLRKVYDMIIKQKHGSTPETLSQAVWGTPKSLVTIVSPERYVPELKNTLFLRNTRKIVAELLGVESTQLLSGWRLFFKAAHWGATPWHQDTAYRPPPYNGASVWMPLDPATSESGCLHYIGRSHREAIRPHHLHDDHWVADDVDVSQAVACPLAPGGAAVHSCRTLHYAGPNKTDRPRRAMVIVNQVAATRGGPEPETREASA